MLIGRFIGTFIAAFLAAAFQSNALLEELFLLLLFSVVGLIIGMIFSVLLGININTDQPIAQDSLKYWTDKYGEDLGKKSYEIWLEEFDAIPEDVSEYPANIDNR